MVGLWFCGAGTTPCDAGAEYFMGLMPFLIPTSREYFIIVIVNL